MYKIIVADDNETFRKGLVFFLEQILGHHIINEANNGEELLNLPNIHLADIVLVDIEMPQKSGVDAMRQINWLFHNVKSIAITSYSDKVYLEQLIGAGFKGYVLKKNLYDELPKALSSVINNEYYFRNIDRETFAK
jgi:DNA-binding NarL/FixJ family response regulator